VIPGNDDAIRSIRIFVEAIADAALAGNTDLQGGPVGDEFVEVAEASAEEAATEEAPAAEAEAPAAEAEQAAPAEEKAGE
jgi:small subunit ribosomal protein S2